MTSSSMLLILAVLFFGLIWLYRSHRKIAGVVLTFIIGAMLLLIIIDWWPLILLAMIGLPLLYGLFIAPMQALDQGDEEPMKIITTQNTWRAMGKNPYTFDD